MLFTEELQKKFSSDHTFFVKKILLNNVKIQVIYVEKFLTKIDIYMPLQISPRVFLCYIHFC